VVPEFPSKQNGLKTWKPITQQQCHIPEESKPELHGCKNLKTYIAKTLTLERQLIFKFVVNGF
jgi:hypothetical protein